MANRRVRVGARYRFEPVLIDKTDPPFNLVPGDIVTVINLPGCPKANTMGHCHVSKDGQFAGLVCTNSLVPIRAKYETCPNCEASFELINGSFPKHRGIKGGICQ
jgi:hypothetical protein